MERKPIEKNTKGFRRLAKNMKSKVALYYRRLY